MSNQKISNRNTKKPRLRQKKKKHIRFDRFIWDSSDLRLVKPVQEDRITAKDKL